MGLRDTFQRLVDEGCDGLPNMMSMQKLQECGGRQHTAAPGVDTLFVTL